MINWLEIMRTDFGFRKLSKHVFDTGEIPKEVLEYIERKREAREVFDGKDRAISMLITFQQNKNKRVEQNNLNRDGYTDLKRVHEIFYEIMDRLLDIKDEKILLEIVEIAEYWIFKANGRVD